VECHQSAESQNRNSEWMRYTFQFFFKIMIWTPSSFNPRKLARCGPLWPTVSRRTPIPKTPWRHLRRGRSSTPAASLGRCRGNSWWLDSDSYDHMICMYVCIYIYDIYIYIYITCKWFIHGDILRLLRVHSWWYVFIVHAWWLIFQRWSNRDNDRMVTHSD